MKSAVTPSGAGEPHLQAMISSHEDSEMLSVSHILKYSVGITDSSKLLASVQKMIDVHVCTCEHNKYITKGFFQPWHIAAKHN
jgi:hypothetical protein